MEVILMRMEMKFPKQCQMEAIHMTLETKFENNVRWKQFTQHWGEKKMLECGQEA
jgi:hypothetical protein